MRAMSILLGLLFGFGLVACDEGGTLGDDDDDDTTGAQPPFDLDALSCEHAFVNERLGGVHYWLLDLQQDGSFTAIFPNTTGDLVEGTYDGETGAITAVMSFDDGYSLVTEELDGTVLFEANGDAEGEFSSTRTHLDGFVEEQVRTSSVVGCVRTVTGSYHDRDGELVSGEIVTTFTGDRTADEIMEADLGEDVTMSRTSELFEDFTRADSLAVDDVTTDVQPDQQTERVMEADGSGFGTYVNQRDDGGEIAGERQYHRDGDQEEDWEMTLPAAPVNPVAWGQTNRYLEGSGDSEYTRLGADGSEVHCTSEWGTDGHGSTQCDDGTSEEF
jgi:hypothetical protein